MSKKDQIVRLLNEGKTYSQIAIEIGCSKGTIAFHANNAGLASRSSAAKRYNWKEIQAYHDAGHGMVECQRYFGFHNAAWSRAIERGDIRPNPSMYVLPIEELLARKERINGAHLKSRLLVAGLLEYRCAECGISDWRGNPLSLEIDHINGICEDNRLDNLRLICPNCHSQTDTYRGKNIKDRGNQGFANKKNKKPAP